MATPGFVDCHLHSSFQLSRGLADEANAQSFLFDRMYPYEAALDADDVRVSATLAATELLKHGVTCFIDPGNYHPEVVGRRRDVDRHPHGRVALLVRPDQVGARPPARADDREHRDSRWSAPRRCWRNTAKTGNPRLGASASFRGLNNASDELIVGLDKLAKKYDTLLQTHACFSYSTHDSSIARGGLAEIERLDKLGVLDERMLIVHSGWLEPQEVAMLAKRKPSLVCAPIVEPAQRLRQFRRRQAARADGARRQRRDRLRPRLVRHRRHDAGDAARLLLLQGDAAQSARHAAGNRRSRWRPSTAPRRRCWTTASARIEVGKEADVVLFDTQRPEWQPLINPVANLVYSATGDSVRDVFVAGEQVVADGTLTKIDESKLYDEIPVAVMRFASISRSTRWCN